MTVAELDRVTHMAELATYAINVRRKTNVWPPTCNVALATFALPDGFDYDEFLAAVNEELRRGEVAAHASSSEMHDGEGRRLICVAPCPLYKKGGDDAAT